MRYVLDLKCEPILAEVLLHSSEFRQRLRGVELGVAKLKYVISLTVSVALTYL